MPRQERVIRQNGAVVDLVLAEKRFSSPYLQAAPTLKEQGVLEELVAVEEIMSRMG